MSRIFLPNKKLIIPDGVKVTNSTSSNNVAKVVSKADKEADAKRRKDDSESRKTEARKSEPLGEVKINNKYKPAKPVVGVEGKSEKVKSGKSSEGKKIVAEILPPLLKPSSIGPSSPVSLGGVGTTGSTGKKDKKSCLGCSKFMTCVDIKKAFNYYCNKFEVRGSSIDLDSFAKQNTVAEEATVSSKVNKHVKRDTTVKKYEVDNVDSDVDPGDFNVQKLIREASSDSHNVAKAGGIKIDDRDLSYAPNFVSFLIDSFGEVGYEPWAKQIMFGSMLFGDYCWSPTCSDARYAKNIPVGDTVDQVLERITFLEWGKCPTCGKTRHDFWNEGKQHDYYEFVALLGQRCGKSSITALMFAYQLQRLIKLGVPAKVYPGVLPSTPLVATFVAVSFKQAKDALYEPFLGMVESSSFYKEYHKILDYYGNKHGEQLYKVRDTFVWYSPSNLSLFPSTTSGKTLRGYTRWGAACLSGDSLVLTDKGFIEIKNNLVGFTTNTTTNEMKTISNWAYTGKKEVKRVTLANGLWLKVTDDHKIPVLTKTLDIETKRVEDLQVGDYVGVAYNTQVFPKVNPEFTFSHAYPVRKYVEIIKKVGELGTFRLSDLGILGNTSSARNTVIKLAKAGMVYVDHRVGRFRVYKITSEFTIDKAIASQTSGKFKRYDITFPATMTPDLAALLGWFVSEGTYSEIAREFMICNTDKVAADHIVNSAEKVFGVAPRINLDTRGGNSPYKSIWRIFFAYENTKNFLRYVGLTPSLSKTKTIPWSVLTSTKDCQKAFLQTLFEGDGCCCTVDCKVSYATTSKKLALQLQMMLLNFGIYSNLIVYDGSKRSDKYNISYHIELPVIEGMKFIKRIGFLTKNKAYLKESTSNRYTHFRLPYISFTGKYPDKSGAFQKVKTHVYSIDYANRKTKNRGLNKAMFVPGIQDKMEALIDNHTIWQPIKSIKKLKPAVKTYDITVDDATHSLVAHGMRINNCDELGHLAAKDKGAVKMNPDLVVDALRRSLLTVRAGADTLHRKGNYDVPHVLFANVSSPMHLTDKIVRLYEESKNSESMLGYHYSVFEVNPLITEKVLEAERRSDPEGYKRDYLAIPPRATHVFLPSKSVLTSAVGKHKNIIALTQETGKSAAGLPIIRAKAKVLKKDAVTPRVLAIDAGRTDNAFGGCIMHLRQTTVGKDKEGNELIEEMPTVDAFFEIVPEPKKPVNFNNVYEKVLRPIMIGLNIKYIVADRWNSAKILDDLEAEFGCGWSFWTLRWENFLLVKNSFINSEVLLPKPEISLSDAMTLSSKNYPFSMIGKPVSHFMVEAMTVEESMGKTVEKGDKRTDDLFRAFCLAYCALHDEEIRDEYLFGEEEPPAKAIDTGSLCFYGSYGGGGSAPTSRGGGIGSGATGNFFSGSLSGGSGHSSGGGASGVTGKVFTGGDKK